MYTGGLVDSRKIATRNGSDKPSPIAANDADLIEHCVHVIVKNLQSIRCESRWEDFIAELDQCDFDLLLICETWRGERDESFITERGHHIYLSGGAHHQGVGICTSAHFASRISLWPSGGSEFSVVTFQRLGMRMVQWNKCMMC